MQLSKWGKWKGYHLSDTNIQKGDLFCSKIVLKIACVASVSVRFRSKERGTRVKDRVKNGASKRAERGWGRKEGNLFLFSPSLPSLLFFGSHGLISRAIKTETPLPRSLFAPKANGNACYAGYIKKDKGLDLGAEPPRIKLCWVPPHPPPPGGDWPCSKRYGKRNDSPEVILLKRAWYRTNMEGIRRQWPLWYVKSTREINT